ncbi:MAG: sigma-70 family RNA polymerase sigma factor [Taibaiella sp.]|nr:sigma-70 family RNA polymerase sigma factor [Taibaiella sp.]
MNPQRQHSTDEGTLARLSAAGNGNAQRELFLRFNDSMLILCMRYVANREDAREAMMDGFLAAFKNMTRFEWRGPGSLKAWLSRVMVNQCLSRLRTRKLSFEYSELPVEQYDRGGGDEIVAKMNAKEILAMIHTLPDGCKTVFNLYVFEEMGHAEIGEVLGISENTSKSQLHRARTLLKEKIVKTEKQLYETGN